MVVDMSPYQETLTLKFHFPQPNILSTPLSFNIFIYALPKYNIGQWWSEPTVNILGNIGDQLFLINLYMEIMKIWGDQARAGAFCQKWLYFVDQNDENTKFSKICQQKNDDLEH